MPPISQADLARFRGVRRSTREAPGPLSGSIRTMGDVTGVAVIGTRRCGSGARDGAHAPADSRADASTMAAAGDRADYSPSAGAYQTAAHRPIGGIVRVREGRRRQHQSSADYACYGRLLCHSRSTEEARGVEPACWSACYRGPTQRAIHETNKWRGVAVPVAAAPGLAYDQLGHHLKKHVLNARRRSAARAQGVEEQWRPILAGLTHARDGSVVLPC